MTTPSAEQILQETIAKSAAALEEERKKSPEEIVKANRARARKIERHLKLPTLPVGVRFWREGETIPDNAGTPPRRKYTYCQILSMIRFNAEEDRDITLIKQDDLTCHLAMGVLGYEDMPPNVTEGNSGIHFYDRDLCISAMATIPKIPFRVKAITIGALENLPIVPDVIVMGVTPGRTNKVMDGAMWYKGGSFAVRYGNGCGACGNATAEPMTSDQVATLAFMCHGARRWGGFEDNELGCGVRIDKFDVWVAGMEATWLTGHSYPPAHQLPSDIRETHHVQKGTKYEEAYPYCLDA